MKSLVVYFSRTGENSVAGKVEVIEKGYTEIVAEKIVEFTHADLFKLEPVEPYPYKYDECVKRANDEGLVEYKFKDFSIADYDTIFLGFPCWWRSYPRIVATFLRDHDFVGKTIIPFCTNEEGAFGVAVNELKASVKGAVVKNGFAARGYEVNDADEKIKEWLGKVYE